MPKNTLDRNGNVSTYDAVSREWTDTLGRDIKDPLKNPFNSPPLNAGEQEYKLKGIGNVDLTYRLMWEKLENSFEHSSTQLEYNGADTCQNVLMHAVSGNSLFQNAPVREYEDSPNGTQIQYIENTRFCVNGGTAPKLFNPVVMTSVKLPDGQKYQFKYNEYGEITKIIYPTGGYERFKYQEVPPMGSNTNETYAQTNRGVHQRFVSFDGTTEILQATYQASGTGDYKITTTARDESYTERIVHTSDNSAWGFEDPLAGMVKEERAYDSSAAHLIKSRSLTEWTTTPAQGTGAYEYAKRDPRPVTQISIIFEKGKALATMSETEYETPNDTTVPSDPKYFARLNAKQVKSYHYLSLDSENAKNITLDNLKIAFHTSAQVAGINQTEYQYSAAYLNRGFPSLPTETRSLDPANPTPANPTDVLAKSRMIYDEQNLYYSLDTSNTTSVGYVAPSGVNASLRGNATTTQTWVKETDSWLSAHTQYDTFGNARKVWDISGDQNKFAETQYDAANYYAYPTKVITPATNIGSSDFGSTDSSTVETTYDFTTGLPLSVTNDAGQITKTEYDAFSRPWRTYAFNYTAPETQTIYGAPDPVTGQFAANQRFVKTRKQIDANNWDEATTWTDGLGRTTKTQAKDSAGDVFTETQYDQMGRAVMTTNPYRAGDTKLWNLTEFDAAGRAYRSRAPVAVQNPEEPTGDILGTSAFDISTVAGFVGTVGISTDASGRKSRSITNALGQLLRVDEATATGGTIDADLGNIATPHQPTFYKYDVYGKMVRVQQGKTGETIQNRFFLYDSFGRLLRVRQPEQEINSALNTAGNPDNNSWTAKFTYDIFGNVLTATDSRNVTITNTYDRASRILTKTYSGELAGQQTPTVYFTYDGKYYEPNGFPRTATGKAKGSLTQVRNGNSTSQTIEYDALGRAKVYQQITDSHTYTSEYTYNFAGALSEEKYPDGRVVKNEFNSDGDLSRILGKANQAATEKTYANGFSYTADGRIAKLHLGNGLWEAAKFNTRLQITELGVGLGAENLDKWRINYDYGELNTDGVTFDQTKNTGNIARQTVSFQGLANPFVQTYRYDSLNRLKEARETSGAAADAPQTWRQDFAYDRFGNRTNFAQQGAGIAPVQPTIDSATNRFNTGQGITYDKNGNIITDAVSGASRNFIFNGDNKQTEVRDANTNLVGQYFYDGEGKRVKKVTANDTTIFVYSGGKLIQEYSTVTPPPTPTTNYVATDILQSVRAITNALGEVTSRRDFMPFGEELYPDATYRTDSQKYSSQSDTVKQKFTGYQKDDETSLDFAEARMYQNSHGRFTAVDPLLASGKSANPQTFNRYVYCLNNPLNLIDPTGMQAGKWYKPIEPDGIKTFTYGKTAPEGYTEVVERNRVGELVGNAVGLDENFTLRFNPAGPMSSTALASAASLGLYKDITPYERDGYDITYSDIFRDKVNNEVNPGVRDVSLEFYSVVLPTAQLGGNVFRAGTGAAVEGISSRLSSISFKNSESLGPAATFGEKLFTTEGAGVTSSRFGNSAAGLAGSNNQKGSFFKFGWSSVDNPRTFFDGRIQMSPVTGDGGMQFRIGIGRNPTTPSQSRFHFYIPRSFVSNNFANQTNALKKGLLESQSRKPMFPIDLPR